MKIQTVVQGKSGISYHRLVNPFSYLQLAEGDIKEQIWHGQEEHLIDGNTGILWYNKSIFTDPGYIRKLQEEGMKVVVDVDDFWELPCTHINYKAWKEQNHSQRILEHIQLADIVVCTTMKLQGKVRQYNKNTVVIPNAFPFGYENYTPQPIEHEKVIFMYMGGSTHLPDVKILEGKFRRINSDLSIKEHAEFVVCGYEPMHTKQYYTNQDLQLQNDNYHLKKVPGVWDSIEAVFSYTGCHRVLPTADLDDYLNYLDQADVFLIPLQPTFWNSFKSPLKIIEAAVKGIPVICSKVEPYYPELKECPGILWVEYPDDWLKHIKWCIKNKAKLKDMGNQLMEYCKEHYDLLVWNETRKAIIDKLR